MANKTSSMEPVLRPPRSGFEEHLWPIICATMVLTGILGVVICVNSDFEEERLFLNGYTYLAGLGIAALLLIFVAARLKGAVRRTAELTILCSLVLHASAGVGAFYLFQIPASGFNVANAPRETAAENDDGAPTDANQWTQDDEQDQEQSKQAFEKVVDTPLHDQAPPAAQLQPRNMDRPMPATDIPRVPNVEVTPLGVGGVPEPGGPVNVRRPGAAKIDDAKPPETLAMVRQKGDEVPLPKPVAAAVAIPAAAKELPKDSEPAIGPSASEAGKPSKIDWARVAKKAAERDDGPAPPPHKLTRVETQPTEPLPAPDLIARLPAQAAQNLDAPSGPEAADQVTQRPSSLDRSNRDGSLLPSTVIPDAGLPAQMPAAPGSSPPSRVGAESVVPVERSDTSHAPLGPMIASNGNQDFGRGSTALPSRRGALDGHGKAPPAIEGDSPEDPAAVRSGSPSSDLNRGPSAPVAPARRAIASQPEDGGSGPSANRSARLPKTQAEMGLDLPTAARSGDVPAISGAGGTAPNPGGQTSNLDVGPRISVRRTAGGGPARSVTDSGPDVVAGLNDVPPGNKPADGGNGAASPDGLVAPRRIAGRTPDGTDDGIGSVPRSRPDAFDLHGPTIPVGPVAATSAPDGLPSGGTPRGSGAQAIGPSAGPGGIGRRATFGQGIGSRPAGQVEPAEISPQIGVVSPQPSGTRGRGGQGGGGPSDADLAGGGLGGVGGVGRGRGQVVVSADVHEPLEPFRRPPVHGGMAGGDPAGGQLTEPAIENGLEFFARTQFGDGHWSLHESPDGADPATLGSLHADTAATGLGLLTYLGAGYNHQNEKYHDVVRRGLDWLVKHQQPDGDLSYQGSGPAADPTNDPTHFYSHGIATMALCEAYGMTQDRELREPAQKAIDFIVKSQDPQRGGWRYRPREGSDTSVTGWQLMALKSAQMAGLDVPPETLTKVGQWLDLAHVSNSGTYVYNPWNADTEVERQGRAPSPTMTAQAMIMRMYLGQDRDQATLAKGADYLLTRLPEAGPAEVVPHDCYYWYYSTQAMYHMQGNYWKSWDERVTPLVRAGQVDRGPSKGSWNPREPVPDHWSAFGGRHYVTAMHVLTLEFRYWHLPLFRELRKE